MKLGVIGVGNMATAILGGIIKNDVWVLSTQYEIAAEQLLGYGGVWTKDPKQYRYFKTHKEAVKELRLMNHYGQGRGAIILRYDK